MPELAAAVYARGWSYAIDREGGDYRATVSQSGKNSLRFRTVATGWTMETALALCLARALAIARPPIELPSA
jgi:hypothetical protein